MNDPADATGNTGGTAWHPVVPLFVTIVVLAVLDAVLPDAIVNGNAYLFGGGFLVLFLIFQCFLADARAFGVRPTAAMKVAVLVLPPIALLYFRARHGGARAAMRCFAAMVGILALYTAVLLVTNDLVYNLAG